MKKYIFLIASLLIPQVSWAHVKWFSDFDFVAKPLELSQLSHPLFWGLFILSLISLPVLVYLDKIANISSLYLKTNAFLDRYADNGPLIMRVAMSAVLLMSWQGDSVIAPEIPISNPLWGWFQFLLALLLLFKETTPVTGLGIIILYFIGITQHGLFHMLDYVVYPAVGLYLIVTQAKNERIRNFDLPVIYSGLGFSLCWVAFEKMIYPFWGLSVLNKAPALTMGMDHEFFLLSCAFIEFTLGYLLIICLLHRPLAVVITLTFFITTSFFGKTEVVGHTILHGALLVFIVKGPGHYYQAPIRYHKSLFMRSLFTVVNYIILFVALAIPYQYLAKKAYAESAMKRAENAHPQFVIPDGAKKPGLMIHPYKDTKGGWNLHLMTENFLFTPQNAGGDDVMGEGHAHLFVDGKKVARVYGNWIHVTLPTGPHKVKVNLTTNTHKDYYADGKPIEAEIDLEESRKFNQHDHH